MAPEGAQQPGHLQAAVGVGGFMVCLTQLLAPEALLRTLPLPLVVPIAPSPSQEETNKKDTHPTPHTHTITWCRASLLV